MKIIMTATRSDKDAATNHINNLALVEAFDQRFDITAQPVKGFWKGEAEPSYIMQTDNQYVLIEAFLMAQQYEQDAILLVRDDNRAELIDCQTGSRTDIGDWQKVSPHVARMFDAYTVDGSGTHWVACTKAERAVAERRSLSLMSLMDIETVTYAALAV